MVWLGEGGDGTNDAVGFFEEFIVGLGAGAAGVDVVFLEEGVEEGR